MLSQITERNQETRRSSFSEVVSGAAEVDGGIRATSNDQQFLTNSGSEQDIRIQRLQRRVAELTERLSESLDQQEQLNREIAELRRSNKAESDARVTALQKEHATILDRLHAELSSLQTRERLHQREINELSFSNEVETNRLRQRRSREPATIPEPEISLSTAPAGHHERLRDQVAFLRGRLYNQDRSTRRRVRTVEAAPQFAYVDQAGYSGRFHYTNDTYYNEILRFD